MDRTFFAAGKPSCTNCVGYYISHDVKFPYGCRTMGFKSERLPSQQVAAVTGAPCLAYQPRKRTQSR